jgi:hypothetical protein
MSEFSDSIFLVFQSVHLHAQDFGKFVDPESFVGCSSYTLFLRVLGLITGVDLSASSSFISNNIWFSAGHFSNAKGLIHAIFDVKVFNSISVQIFPSLIHIFDFNQMKHNCAKLVIRFFFNLFFSFLVLELKLYVKISLEHFLNSIVKIFIAIFLLHLLIDIISQLNWLFVVL